MEYNIGLNELEWFFMEMIKKEEIGQRAYTISAFCKLFGVSKSTYFTWARLGILPRIIKINQRPFILKEDLEEWVKKMKK